MTQHAAGKERLHAAAIEAPASHGVHDVTVDPPPPRWKELLAGAPQTDARLAARSRLGLPPGPLIVSGHQPGFWHAGIAAKWFALDAACRAYGASPAWVVVDHDAIDPLMIRYPGRSADGVLIERLLSLGPPTPDTAPACMRPPANIGPEGPQDAATPEINAGLAAAVVALRGAEAEPNAAAQAHAAVCTLLAPSTPAPRPLFASGLLALRAFDDLLAVLRDEPRAAHDSYNRALAAAPAAQLRPLEKRDGDVELPLWRLTVAQREPIFASQLLDADPASLAPRALMLTLMLRARVADLFIHGIGGGATDTDSGYDRATEVWARDWLGERLAPAVVVSATCFPAFSPDDAPTPRDAAAAVALAHRAAHNPALIGDPVAQAKKQQILAEIAAARAGQVDPAPAFRRMHALLDAARQQHHHAIAAMHERSMTLRARAAGAALASDRTWPFPLLGGTRLAALRDELHARFAATPVEHADLRSRHAPTR